MGSHFAEEVIAGAWDVSPTQLGVLVRLVEAAAVVAAVHLVVADPPEIKVDDLV